MKGILLQILITLILRNTLFAQTVFEKTYPVNINNKRLYISQLLGTPDSGYVFATTAYNNGDNVILIGRLDKNGNVDWVKQVNDLNTIRAVNIDLSLDGYLYATFSVYLTSQSSYFSIVLKFDIAGNLIWSKSYGGPNVDQHSEHTFISSSSIFIAGELRTLTAGGQSELYLLKIDTSGILQWGKTYDAGGSDNLRSAKQLSNGDILLSGWTIDSLSRNYVSLFRIDVNGIIIWGKRFHVPSYKRFNAQAVNEDFSGDLLISGYVDTVDTGIGFGLWDIFLMKLSSAGNFKWGKIYGGSDYDESFSIAPTNDNGYIIGAEPESYGNVSRIGLLKTDSVGNVVWMRLYGDTSGGFPNNVVINEDNGYTILATDGDYDVIAPMVLIRTDSMGRTVCNDTLVTIQEDSFQPASDSIGTVGTLTGFVPFTRVISVYPLMALDYCEPNSICELILTTNSVTAHVTCIGASDGAAKAFATGGTPPYSFLWSDGQTTDVPTGFPSGTHSVTVTDYNGCTATTSITIGEGPLPCTGIQENLLNNISLYPNPTNGTVMLKAEIPSAIGRMESLVIKLYDALGRQVNPNLTPSSPAGEGSSLCFSIDLKDLAGNIFFLHISTEQEHRVMKVGKVLSF